MTLALRGITWDHERGRSSVEAAAAEYSRSHDVQITWQVRSLQAFADQGLAALTEEFDLLVIDHPHIPHAAAAGLLAEMPDADGPDAFVGRSFASYRWNGAQYGLAIDAAAQVSAYRPDLLREIPRSWDDVLALAADGGVLWPSKPIDAFASAFTLTSGFMGRDAGRGKFGSGESFAQAWDLMLRLRDLVPAECATQNPIQVAEQLADGDRWCYAPLLYGYSNYARSGFRDQVVQWADIPEIDGEPKGSMLGGAGLAVSALRPHREAALEFAMWVATPHVQRGVYLKGGGQPGHVHAWEDPRANQMTRNFFTETRRTLDLSSLRPQHPDYMAVQDAAAERVHAGLARRDSAASVLEDLDVMFQSLAARGRDSAHAAG